MGFFASELQCQSHNKELSGEFTIGVYSRANYTQLEKFLRIKEICGMAV